MTLSGEALNAAISQIAVDITTAEDKLHNVKANLGLCISGMQKAANARAAKSLMRAEDSVRAAQSSLDDAAISINDVTGADD